MTLHYKLLPHSGRGILLTTDTPLLDVDSGFLLSFSLPEPGEYVAILTAQNGKEHTVRIGESPVPIPPALLKPQLIAVTVLQLKDAKPYKRWACPPIRITSLAAQNQLTLTAAADLANLPEQVNVLEELYNGALEKIEAFEVVNADLRAELAKKREDLRAEVSQDMSALVKYKELNTTELKKIVDAVNATNKEIAAIKSEFSL